MQRLGKPLKDVIAFIDVTSSEDSGASGTLKKKLKELGAKVNKNKTKKITHAICNTSNKEVFDWAKKNKIHLVSAQWVLDSSKNKEK